MANWLPGRVENRIQWNARLFSLRIAVDFSRFKPGQFTRVALDIDGERVARPYSLVNTPDAPLLEIFFNIVPEGPLSPRLAALAEGDRIWVSDAVNGFLTVDEVPPCRHLWMLATGTGIGPFLSILQSGVGRARFDRLVLGYSVREASELAYQPLLQQLVGDYAGQLVYVPFVTREPVEGAMHQRITECLRDGSFEVRAGIEITPADSHVMLCGNAAMIGEVSELLGERGLRKHLRRKPGHISTEKYH